MSALLRRAGSSRPARIGRALVHGLIATVLAAGLVLGVQSAAGAHVTATAADASPGGYTTLTFRVPTESDTASTVGLEVHLPQETPFTAVRVKPVPGWTAEVVTTALDAPVTSAGGTTVTEAPTVVRWTATDGGLTPQQFGEFEISVGPLPAQGTLFFPTVQRYSDGSQVDWAQQAAEGVETDTPAPSITIGASAAGAADAHGSAVGGASDAGSDSGPEASAAQDGAPAGDGAALVVAIVALFVAALAAVIAVVGAVRRR